MTLPGWLVAVGRVVSAAMQERTSVSYQTRNGKMQYGNTGRGAASSL